MRAAKVNSIDDRQIVFKLKFAEEKKLKDKVIDLNISGDKVLRDNKKIEKAIGMLEHQIEERKYDIYSIENRETIKNLDQMLEDKQTELDTLSYINS